MGKNSKSIPAVEKTYFEYVVKIPGMWELFALLNSVNVAAFGPTLMSLSSAIISYLENEKNSKIRLNYYSRRVQVKYIFPLSCLCSNVHIVSSDYISQC